MCSVFDVRALLHSYRHARTHVCGAGDFSSCSTQHERVGKSIDLLVARTFDAPCVCRPPVTSPHAGISALRQIIDLKPSTMDVVVRFLRQVGCS